MPGTADIDAAPTNAFAGDGNGLYANLRGDEVSFGTRGPYGSNYLFVTAGGPRSERFTTLTFAGASTTCERSVFVITSTTTPDWYIDGGSEAVLGRARLLCEPRSGGADLEARWGEGATGDCVWITRDRATSTFTFSPVSGCVATVTRVDRPTRTLLGVSEGAFHVTAATAEARR